MSNNILLVNEDSLTNIANAIRMRTTFSNSLIFPDGFSNAISNIPDNREPIASTIITSNPQTTISNLDEINNTFVIDNSNFPIGGSYYNDGILLYVDTSLITTPNAFCVPNACRNAKIHIISNGDGTYSFDNDGTILSLACNETYKNIAAWKIEKGPTQLFLNSSEFTNLLEAGHTLLLTARILSGTCIIGDLIDDDNKSLFDSTSKKCIRMSYYKDNTTEVLTWYECLGFRGQLGGLILAEQFPHFTTVKLKLINNICEMYGTIGGYWYQNANDGRLTIKNWEISGGFIWSGLSKIKMKVGNYNSIANGSYIKVYDLGVEL